MLAPASESRPRILKEMSRRAIIGSRPDPEESGTCATFKKCPVGLASTPTVIV
jgi:hypothetical protein